MPLISISCAWILGTWLGNFFPLPPALMLTGLAPLALLFTRRHRQAIIVTSLCLVSLFGAASHAYSSLYRNDVTTLRFYNGGGTVSLRGVVASAPDIREKGTQLNLKAREINPGGGWQPVAGTALVFVPHYPEYHYGDLLLLTGELSTPPQFADFDYRNYLTHQGIYTTMGYPKITVLDNGQGFPLLAGVYALRDNLALTFSRVLPEPQASLAQAIVLGIRGNLPPELKDSFARSGAAHLLAISGLNLSIIAGMLLSAGIWLFGRRHYLYIWLALGVIWLYALLTGMQPPVTRGAFMASLFLFAELLGRQRSAFTALAFAAAVMVGFSPYILGDASFQLSFLAMCGLVFLYPAFRSPGEQIILARAGPEGPASALLHTLNDSLSATLAALVAVWPLIAHYFGYVSLVAPLATLLLLPVQPAIIVTGALTGMLGLFSMPAAQVTGWLLWLCLGYTTVLVNALAACPYSSAASALPVPFIAAYYLLLGFIFLMARRRGPAGLAAPTGTGSKTPLRPRERRPLKALVTGLLIIAVLMSVTAATLPDSRLRVSFLDVGQGDAILIQRGSQQVLVDGGPSPQRIILEMGRQMPFWDRTIEMVVLTHEHEDHLAGLVEVLQRYRVGQVLTGGAGGDTALGAEWRRLIAERDIPCLAARPGQVISLGDGAALQVLHPAALMTGTPSDADNNSVVLRLCQGDFSCLLTGDIMGEAEAELVYRRAGLGSTVLKVPHHGSVTSTGAGFLAAVNPCLAVISVGAGNSFGHPDPEVLARLEQRLGPGNIYRTDINGTVTLTTDGQRLWVETANRPER